MTKWKVADTSGVDGGKIEYTILEKPLLHVCCNVDRFADTNIDIRFEVKPEVVCDVRGGLPLKDNSFAAVFGDFPWIEAWRFDAARAIKEMLRVSPIVYTLCPWVYGARTCYPDMCKYSWRPGINHPILFVRYIRR